MIKDKSMANEQNEHGNTPGNIVNDGYAAIQGDWISYMNWNDKDRQYIIKTDGSGRRMVE
uniref:Uncharacterized protein n=1 Tax=uncultured bacterium contig00151 TaxID=1181590 RepID=A0A806K1X9_9BACT|nr:hypothetical protein [uncultured bacterium contig00151]